MPADAATVHPRANSDELAIASSETGEHQSGPQLGPQRGLLRAFVVATRPRQWVKNALVVSAPGAAGVITHDGVPGHVLLAVLAFCMVSSSVYLINDVRDLHEDRQHPRKRLRPIAAGELNPSQALTAATALIVAALALCALVRPLLVLVVAGYVGLNLSYTLLWRRLALFDIGAIAGGFLLRAVAGGVAAPVSLSRLFLLVVTFVALFVAAGKRYAELRRGTAGAGAPVRAVLALYTPQRLRAILWAAGLAAVAAYAAWAFELPTVDGVPWRPLTILPFAFCLLRYGVRLRTGAGEAPEDLLLSDRLLQLAGLVWLLVFGLGVNAAS